MTARFRRRAEARRASAAQLALRVVPPAAVLLLLLSAAAAAPATALGKILSAALMVFGFITLATTTAAVASLFVREDELPEERREQGFEQRMVDELRALTRRLAAIERELDRKSAQTASAAVSTAPAGTSPP